MNQLVTTPPSDLILFDDYSARTDSLFWANELRWRSVVAVIETSTALALPQKTAKSEIDELFAREVSDSLGEEFDPKWGHDLQAIILRHGELAIDALTGSVLSDRVNRELASEAFRELGRIKDPTSYRRRLWLLESGLFSNSPRIRDAASLALTSLDDPHAIPYLRKAIEEEKCDELRDDLRQVLEQLQETQACR